MKAPRALSGSQKTPALASSPRLTGNMAKAGRHFQTMAGLLVQKSTAKPPDDSASDPISSAVRRGLEHGAGGADPADWAIQRVSAELARSQGQERDEAMLERALALVEAYPSSEVLQLIAAQVIEAVRGEKPAAQAWAGIEGRFLSALDVFRTSIRQCIRTRGRPAAVEEAAALDYEGTGLVSVGVKKALALEELSEHAASDRVFSALIARFPSAEFVRTEFCRTLVARKLYLQALSVATEAIARFPTSMTLKDLQSDVSRVLADFELVAPGILSREGPLSCLLIENLLGTFAAYRADALAVPRPYLGSTVLITGTLGLGGAERQLVNTATQLGRAAREGRVVSRWPVLGPITVCARDLDSAKGHDFFYDDVRRAGVEVVQYLGFPVGGGDARASLSTQYRNILRFLPTQTAEGIQRLLDWLTWQRPDVVQIWQDGMVYATALAAVMAGVPRIVMSHRTLPPIDRRDRYKAEHEVMYRTLARLPGVSLTTNSLVAARRFEEWLGLEANSVLTIPNGVVPTDEEPSAAARDQAAAFLAATKDATFTVGGVMRLDENKRPLEWVDVAVALLREIPTTRFIVVGDGPLQASMKEYVRLRGFQTRFLFVGRSHDVPFWLGHTDALLMLSRFEGLPNAAIEAQMAGIPVVATPAGGTAEAIAPDASGLLLPRADTVEVDEAVQRLALIGRNAELRAKMGAAARSWASQTFSVDRMFERTVQVMCS